MVQIVVMPARRKYTRRKDATVTAVRLALDTEGFEYRKWGGKQRCKSGDWLVDNSGETYTVDADTFAKTYREVSPGRYEKHGEVWAERATSTGSIPTKEGKTQYEKGDYLVFNDEQGEDGYAMTPEEFERLYEPIRKAG